MEYYISDPHFGHKNIIAHCKRPFETLEQMNTAMLENWQRCVKPNDTVYIVGDLFWDRQTAESFLPRLPGKKTLVVGNHDAQWLRGGRFDDCFESIVPYLELKGKRPVTVCHYPMIEWNGCDRYGSQKLGYHIYGHIHAESREEYLPVIKKPHALNASAELNGYSPVTFDRLDKNNYEFCLSKLSSPTDRADFVMRYYHKYQLDKAGKAYIYHPLAVASRLDGEDEIAVALLHDTLEDTEITESELRRLFEPAVVDAVKTLTRSPDEDYFSYLERVARNPICVKVKLSDLAHNMDLSRLPTVTEHDLERIEKYKKAVKFLESEGNL